MSLRQRTSIANVSPSTETNESDIGDTTPTTARTPSQSALSQALESTAHLANHLPTGTLLAFQLLTPTFTNNGTCDAATRPMTLILLLLLALSCFLASFTDSVKAADGNLYYGFVTPRGMWLFEYPYDDYSGLPDLSKYRMKVFDVVHAFLSVLVFVTMALRDHSVVSCFYPTPAREVKEVLDIAPMGIGMIASLLFVLFPTKRHGIGYPLLSSRG